MSLKFIAISGTTGVTQNLYVYEYGNDMLVVDCGVGFPEPEMYGVDLVIPDLSYVKENAGRLRGVLVSHGHEDHLGALPFLLTQVKTKVYSTRLVAGFIEDKLADYGLRNFKVNVFDPERDTLSLGSFNVTPFRVSHSVPDGVGFAIDTPEGRVFHVPDYKFDWTPVDGKPFDIAKAALLSTEGVLALASDSLGSTTPGHTESERKIEGIIEEIVTDASGKVFFTTISSNISRIQQALKVAVKVGRKVAFVGRSIDKKAEISRRLGYLHYPEDLVLQPKRLARMDNSKVMYIVSGSYGQPGSALDRVSLGEHDYLSVEKGDVVIFSSDPAPPGSKANVDSVVDRLIEANAEVHYYDMQEDLHVSGHGSQEDIKMLFALLRPKYFIPIGGTIRHMRAYSKLAQGMGAQPESILELRQGEVVEFKNKTASRTGKIPVRDVLVDGLGIGDVGNIVLRDRQVLAKDGVAIILIQFDKTAGKVLAAPDILSRGFVFQDKGQKMLSEASAGLKVQLDKYQKLDVAIVRGTAIDFLEKYFYEKIGRRPMVVPVVVEL